MKMTKMALATVLFAGFVSSASAAIRCEELDESFFCYQSQYGANQFLWLKDYGPGSLAPPINNGAVFFDCPYFVATEFPSRIRNLFSFSFTPTVFQATKVLRCEANLF